VESAKQDSGDGGFDSEVVESAKQDSVDGGSDSEVVESAKQDFDSEVESAKQDSGDGGSDSEVESAERDIENCDGNEVASLPPAFRSAMSWSSRAIKRLKGGPGLGSVVINLADSTRAGSKETCVVATGQSSLTTRSHCFNRAIAERYKKVMARRNDEDPTPFVRYKVCPSLNRCCTVDLIILAFQYLFL
jgi:hypothetical protein